MTLGRAALPAAGPEWARRETSILSSGATDRAVFELRVEGEGRLWADKVSLMPSDNVAGWRRDAVEAVREMKPSILRWGGSTVDPGGYKWKDGIGERDRRPPFRNPVWGRLDTMDVGIGEFLDFCRAVGAEPLLCVSFMDGPASAREMVEYVNGAADSAWGRRRTVDGRREPYGVKLWQVGNEVDEAGYPDRCLEFIRAVKAADPAAVIFTSFPTPALVDKVGALADYYCPHYYRPDLQGIDEDVRRIAALVREKAPGRPVRLAVTEWNINAGGWGLGRGKLDTLGCALFEAQFLNLLHRNSDVVAAACRSNICNSFCGGTIQTNASGLYRIPAFYVMKMFAENSRPVPLRISETPAGLDVTACGSEDGRSLTVFLVNTRRDPVDVEIEPAAASGRWLRTGGVSIADVQDRRQIDVANGWDRPDRVRPLPLRGEGGKILLPALSISSVMFEAR